MRLDNKSGIIVKHTYFDEAEDWRQLHMLGGSLIHAYERAGTMGEECTFATYTS